MSALTRTRAFAATVAVAVAAAAAGCGGSQPTSAPATTAAAKPAAAKPAQKRAAAKSAAGAPDTIHCVDVPKAFAHRILHGVVLDGVKLDRIEAVASPDAPGYYFVSSTVSGGGAQPRSLATWATTGLQPRSHLYSVDSFAALISLYGNAAEVDPDLNIHERAAYQSRVCAGGPKATRGTPAPASGIGNAPATG